MGQSYCGIRRIYTLTTVSGCTEYIEFTVVHIDLNVYIFCLWHDSNGNGGCMDTSARLCFRNTLYTMYTTLVFQQRICALTSDHEADIFHTANTDLLNVHCLHFPAFGFCVMYIHTIDLCCEQSSLVSTCACTDLNDNIFIIIRVFRKQKDLHLFFQFLNTVFGIIQLFL